MPQVLVKSTRKENPIVSHYLAIQGVLTNPSGGIKLRRIIRERDWTNVANNVALHLPKAVSVLQRRMVKHVSLVIKNAR
jgi:hypothetical protein